MKNLEFKAATFNLAGVATTAVVIIEVETGKTVIYTEPQAVNIISTLLDWDMEGSFVVEESAISNKDKEVFRNLVPTAVGDIQDPSFSALMIGWDFSKRSRPRVQPVHIKQGKPYILAVSTEHMLRRNPDLYATIVVYNREEEMQNIWKEMQNEK
jgi:hypothetical protein